jgi:hypothetical protein
LPLAGGHVDQPEAAIHFLRGIDGVDRVRMKARGGDAERGQDHHNSGNERYSHATDEATLIPSIFL